MINYREMRVSLPGEELNRVLERAEEIPTM